MATFVTSYSNDADFFNEYVLGGYQDPLDVMYSFDHEAFAAMDEFTSERHYDPLGGSNTAFHLTGISGELGSEDGTFHAIGSLLGTANPKINGLILTDNVPAGSTLVMTSTNGIVVPDASDNWVAGGAINSFTWDVGTPGNLGATHFEFTGAIAQTSNTASHFSLTRTIEVESEQFTLSATFDGVFKLGEDTANETVLLAGSTVSKATIELGDEIFSISGINANAVTLFNALADDDEGDFTALIPLMLGGNDVISGTGGGEQFLQGFGGNDQINGGGHNDTLIGDAGNDTLIAGGAGSSLSGGLGNDRIQVELQNDSFGNISFADSFDDDGGTDTLVLIGGDGPFPPVPFSGFSFELGDFEAVDASGVYPGIILQITGNSAANTIIGHLGDDYIDGDTGADSMSGGAGNDALSVDNAGDKVGAESAEGGHDFIYSSVSWILGANYEELWLEGEGNVNATGNSLANVINDNGGNNSMAGGDGNDSIEGGGGNDKLDGGNGDDQLSDGSGNNSFAGGLGNDNIQAGGGNDTINAGDGMNTINAGEGINHITGGSGNDEITSGGGNDSINTGAGDNTVNAGSGRNTIVGGAGIDVLNGGNDNDKIDGGAGDDEIDGGEGSDILIGGAGHDFINGSSLGANSIDGGTGNDVIIGLGSNTTVTGGAGDDTISGDFSGAKVDGGDGNDQIYDGGASVSTLLGGGGNDTITVNDNTNTVDGGAGIDLLVMYGSGINGNVTLGGATENLMFSSEIGSSGTGNLLGNMFTSNGDALDTLTGLAGNDTYNVNANDSIVESTAAGGGRDLIVTTDSLTLIDGIEDLTFLGGIGAGTGNAVGNVMTSGDLISNSLIGLGGNDTYNVQSGDTVVENTDDTIGGSADLVIATLTDEQTWSLSGGEGLENLTLLISSGGQVIGHGNSQNNVITGAIGANARNFLHGEGGQDTIKGGAGNDWLDGGNSNDGIDVLVGGAGDDSLVRYLLSTAPGVVTLLNDSMDGGAGSDTVVLERIDGDTMASVVSVSLAAPGFATMENIYAGEAGPSNFNLTGSAGNNSLWGGSLNDSISGGAGNDYLDGGIGDDQLNGGAGDDSYVMTLNSGESTAVLVGGDTVTDTGTGGLGDTLVLTGGFNTMAATFTYDIGANTPNPYENIDASGAASNVKINLTGTSGNNRLIGTMNQDTFTGNAGNDTYGVNIFVDDSLTPFADQILGENTSTGGTDLVIAFLTNGQAWNLGEGLENLTLIDVTEETDLFASGNDLNNVITGAQNEGANNYLSGGNGNDILIGAGGNDQLSGGDGNDTLTGGAGNDQLNGGGGNDKLDGGLGDDSYEVNLKALAAGALEDSITDTGGNDWLSVTGNDTVTGFTYAMTAIDNFTLRNSNAGAKVTGNAGDNYIRGSWGSDSLVGGAGNDTLDGGEGGSNTLLGGAGNDWLDGGEGGGNNSHDGGLGDDTYSGGFGMDSFVLAQAGDQVVDGGEGGIETVIVGQTADQGYLDISEGYGYLENVTYAGTASVSILGNSNFTGNVLKGSTGNDSLFGYNWNDSLSGGKGNDMLDGGEGRDSIAGGDGNDILYGGSHDDTMTGDAGNDSMSGDEGVDSMHGGVGADTMWGGSENDEMEGFDGNDSMMGNGGDDYLSGGAGADTLDGGDMSMSGGSDTLVGGAGDDRYIVDSFGDAIVESMAGGIDTAFVSGSFNARDNGAFVEKFILNDDATLLLANAQANSITGGIDDDTIAGGGGNDTVSGGDGADMFVLGWGSNTIAGGNVMLIKDFDRSEGDSIGLNYVDDLGFIDVIEEGSLISDGIVNGIAANNGTNAQLIYKYSTGELYYDADGTNAGAMVLVAKFDAASKPLELHSEDFSPFAPG